METTLTLARSFGTTPFVLFEYDIDEVIMIINHFIAKGDNQQSETTATTTPLTDREESAAFWGGF